MYKLYISHLSFEPEAQLLANFTGQVTVCTNLPDDEIFLRLDEYGLAIITKQFSPLYVYDLYNKILLRKSGLNRELLIQAMKLKPAAETIIIDATAGFARDSALLGLYGYQVIMLEQNPFLATVIYYALRNKLLPADKLQLIYTNSITYLNTYVGVKPAVIYLDPLFNNQAKALAKKDMQIIQLLTHELPVSDTQLFAAAAGITSKLVVKRDNKQFPLVTTPLPSYAKQGKTIRYDVYLL